MLTDLVLAGTATLAGGAGAGTLKAVVDKADLDAVTTRAS